MVITVVLPKPPSTNHIYGYTSRGGFARSYITKKGQEWFAEATYLIRSQTSKYPSFKETDKLEVYIKLYTAYGNDVDNINKPILDALAKHANLIPNDVQVHKLTTEKFHCKKDEQKVEVAISIYDC